MRIPVSVEFNCRERFFPFMSCVSLSYGWPYLNSARRAAHNMWAAPYTLCIYLHFKIVLKQVQKAGWQTEKLFSPSSLLLALETVSLIASLFVLQYWPVNLFIILEIAEFINLKHLNDLVHEMFLEAEFITDNLFSPSKFDGECNCLKLHLHLRAFKWLPVFTRYQC